VIPKRQHSVLLGQRQSAYSASTRAYSANNSASQVTSVWDADVRARTPQA
jgi:hypothetical protein